MLCDGAEDPATLATLIGAARAQGASVHAIALGARADQGQLSRLANETGGVYHYVGDAAAADGALELALRDLATRVERGVVAFERTVPLGANMDLAIDIPVSPLLVPAVQKVPFRAGEARSGLTVTLMRLALPGTEVPVPGLVRRDGEHHGVFEFRVDEPGTYRLRIRSGASQAPDTLRIAHGALVPQLALVTGIARPGGAPRRHDAFRIGDPVTLQIAPVFPIGVRVASGDVHVEPPGVDGYTTALDPIETGAGSDGDPRWIDLLSHGITLYGTSRGSPTNVADDGSFAGAEGSYPLRFRTELERDDGARATIFSRRAFHVLAATSPADGDADGLPDAHENARACLDPAVPNPTAQDRDGDTLTNFAEYQLGLDPCDTDTDGGGEDDASELAFGGDAHGRGDDRIHPRGFFLIDRSAVDHDGETALPPRALRLVFDRDESPGRIEIRGGPSGGPHVRVFDSSTGAHGKHAGDLESFVHTDLVAGQEYCYFLRAFDAAGRSAARSPIVCGTAREDSNVPWGDITLARGRPRTDGAQVRAYLTLYNEDKATSGMSLALGGLPGGTWQPFAPTVDLDVPSVPTPRRLTLAVQYRDAAGNLSAVYRDALMLYPRGTLGDVAGVVRFEPSAAKSAAPAHGVYVSFADSEREATTVTYANGAFALTDLVPGTHLLAFGHPGRAMREVPVTVVAGLTTTIGDVVLGSDDPVFADGFE